MNYLADTHILVWAMMDSPNLSVQCREILSDSGNQIFFSFVNAWEISIKHNAHPEQMPYTSDEFIRVCGNAGYLELPTRLEHIRSLETLKRSDGAPLHKDPFDRLLLAQAKMESMRFLTHDSLISYYGEPCTILV